MLMNFHAYVPSILYILIYFVLLVLFWLSPSLPLSLFLALIALWHPNANLLHPRTLCIRRHPFPLILHLLLFSSMIREPVRTSWRISLDEAFIRNAKSFCLISLTLHFPLLSTIRVGSHFVVPWSLVPPWWFRSSIPTCTNLFFSTSVFYSRSRYAHCGHYGYCIQGAPSLESSASWLPQLWSFEDRVFVLWDSFYLGWSSEHLLLNLC